MADHAEDGSAQANLLRAFPIDESSEKVDDIWQQVMVYKAFAEGNVLEAYYTVAPTWPQPFSVAIDLDGDDASVLRQIEEAKRAG